MAKLAKCNIHSLSFCNNKHDAPQCDNCILVKHRPKKRIIRDGVELIHCSRCNQYKPANHFRPDSNGYVSWCIDCKHEYGKAYYRLNAQSFIIGYKNKNGVRKFVKVDSAAKMIRRVRLHLIENNELYLEIKKL